jgi:carboxyl-terminal processing protease
MILKKFFKLAVVLMFQIAGLLSYANAQEARVAAGFNFKQLPQHGMIAKTLASMAANNHYQKVKIDDALSAKTFDNYLERLDKSRILFLASDIKAFEKYRLQLDDALSSGELSPAFELFGVYVNRMNERTEYSLKTIQTINKLSSNEVFDFSREQLPWFNSLNEEKLYWNKKVRYELILLMASKKSGKEAKSILTSRYEKLKKKLEKLKSEDAFEQFMNAFTGTIDPHTSYLSPKSSDAFKVTMNKSLVGIGVFLGIKDEYPIINTVVKGGPAEKSNQIAINDRIVALANGDKAPFEDVVGWDITEVTEKIRGEKGSVIRLKILPAGAMITAKPIEVTLLRDKIAMEDQKVKREVQAIKQGKVDQKIGIISIPNFYLDAAAFTKGDPDYASTSKDVRKALAFFKEQGVAGVMVDLRNNPGGSMKEAIDLAGLFISHGPVVQLRDAEGKITPFLDEDTTTVYAGPLTVLVNRLSGSSSEIFTAAMQDYGRAIVIGEQSFGKGTAQNVLPLNQILNKPDQNLGQFNMTMAKFYRINGGSTQNMGVTPDLNFPSKYSVMNVGESTLKNALPYDQVPAATFTKVSEMTAIIEKLKINHEARMQASQELKFLKEDIQQLKEEDTKKSMILDLEKTIRQQADLRKIELNRTNSRRKLQGLKPLVVVDEKTKNTADEMKNESLQVTAELVTELNKL